MKKKDRSIFAHEILESSTSVGRLGFGGMQRKERGTRGCACNRTVRCIEDDADGACAARPMHVVSTSMSRRDLNFPTLSAPYRTPCPLPRALARTLPPPLLHVYSMQLSSPSAPQPPELAMRRDVARCGARARCVYLRARECRWWSPPTRTCVSRDGRADRARVPMHARRHMTFHRCVRAPSPDLFLLSFSSSNVITLALCASHLFSGNAKIRSRESPPCLENSRDSISSATHHLLRRADPLFCVRCRRRKGTMQRDDLSTTG